MEDRCFKTHIEKFWAQINRLLNFQKGDFSGHKSTDF